MSVWDVPEPHDEMVECTFCESGTYDSVTVHYERTGVVTYCRACWIELCGGRPIETRQN